MVVTPLSYLCYIPRTVKENKKKAYSKTFSYFETNINQEGIKSATKKKICKNCDRVINIEGISEFCSLDCDTSYKFREFDSE